MSISGATPLRSVPGSRAGADVPVPDFVGLIAAAGQPPAGEPFAVGQRSYNMIDINY